MPRLVQSICLALSALAVASFPGQAQSSSVPISARVIEGDLLLPDGRAAHFSVRDGAVLSVRSALDSYWYGIFVEIAGADDETIRFTVFEIQKNSDGEQNLELVGSPLESRGGAAVEIQTMNGPFRITPQEVLFRLPMQDRISSQKSAVYQPPNTYDALGICCVTCDDMTVCGGAVNMPCGSCDSGGGGGRPAF